MAEVVGVIASTFTLAEVFKICIDAFELISAAKRHDSDVKNLTLKLKIEKCRLLVWGRSMGLGPSGDGEATSRLDECEFADVVRETLTSVIELLSNSQDLARKYGCRMIEGSDALTATKDAPADPSTRLAAAFSKFGFDTAIKDKAQTAGRKALWLIHDHKKFALLVRDAKDFIDGLQDITHEIATQEKLERTFGGRVTTISDPETLLAIAEVCESDHPAISDAASVRADAMSVAMTDKQDISRWLDTINPSDDLSSTIEDMESWSVTDLKQKFLELTQLVKGSSKGPISNVGVRRQKQYIDSYHPVERGNIERLGKDYPSDEILPDSPQSSRAGYAYSHPKTPPSRIQISDTYLPQRPITPERGLSFRLGMSQKVHDSFSRDDRLKQYIDPAQPVTREDIERLEKYNSSHDVLPDSPQSSRDDYIFTYPRDGFVTVESSPRGRSSDYDRGRAQHTEYSNDRRRQREVNRVEAQFIRYGQAQDN